MVNENIKKKDMELILEVNKKAIEIETEVADQNEEILSILSEIRKDQIEQGKVQAKILEESEQRHKDLMEESTQHHKDLFKMQVLFISGVISLIIQIIQMLKK